MSRLIKMRGNSGESLHDGLDELAKFVKNKLGDNIKIIEIGAYQGESTEIIAKNFPNSEINSVDIWEKYVEDVKGDGTLAYDLDDQQLALEEAEEVFTKRIKNYPNVIKNKNSSLNFSLKIENMSVDFVYIDGNHQYSSVKEDILSWLPKIKIGGIISGHDSGWTTVQQALSECFGNDPDMVFQDSSWLYVKNI